jgi:hypothetical protein
MKSSRNVIPHLRKGEAHWREGFSAHALATVWFGANGVPPSVQALFDSHEAFRGAVLVDAILERETDLRDGIRGASHTDVLAVLGIGPRLAVAAVEGKVDETFGSLVSEWTGPERRDVGEKQVDDKHIRLDRLLKVLGVAQEDAAPLRFQLLHRSAAALYEAERYRAPMALMLVHSFSSKQSGWKDFERFCSAMNAAKDPGPGRILGPKRCAGRDLYLGWLGDTLPVPASVAGVGQ